MPKSALRVVPQTRAATETFTSAQPKLVATPAKRRDSRIDVLRGLALVMIFINHVPGTIFEHVTSRNFGFSDAAEGFVFLSGLSAALAYAGGMSVRPLWAGIRKIWRRAWTLYLVHLMVTLWTIAIVAATLRYGQSGALIGKDNFQFLLRDPIGVLIGLPVLGHQFGYVNILPMYSALLLATPFLLLAALRWPRATLVASILSWAVVGVIKFDVPNHPLSGGWFFNPFAWQFLFVLGMLTGLALKKGQRFVPASRLLTSLSLAFLAFVIVWLRWPALASLMNNSLAWIGSLGVPSLFRDFDKTYVSVPRLLHFLALAYAISVIPNLRRICDAKPFAPLALLGRQALPVFALGTILSFAVRAMKEVAGETTLVLDALLIGAGIAAMLAFAGALDLSRRMAARPVTPV